MFIPLLSGSPSNRKTKRGSNSSSSPSRLSRRKGGGGHASGGAHGSSGGRGGSGTGAGKGTTSGRTTSVALSGSDSAKITATSYGKGGGSITNIPTGRAFAGRPQGGGTRAGVMGSRTYGSGYPGLPGGSVAGRGFPFVFWPLAWGGLASGGSIAYLHSEEYGSPSNPDRVGGPMVSTFITSPSDQRTYRILADNATLTSLAVDVQKNCSSHFQNPQQTLTITPVFDNSSAPKPEQVLQYYRASSVALTYDGYNNSAVWENGSTDTPFDNSVDPVLVDCLNQTIGLSVPLVNSSLAVQSPQLGLIPLVLMLWVLLC